MTFRAYLLTCGLVLVPCMYRSRGLAAAARSTCAVYMSPGYFYLQGLGLSIGPEVLRAPLRESPLSVLCLRERPPSPSREVAVRYYSSTVEPNVLVFSRAE